MQSTPGMPSMVAADDRRVPGWRVLKDYLSAKEGSPKLLISKTCQNLINSMQSLLCDKNRVEDASTNPHAITHSPEALRYAVMSRFDNVFSEKEELPFSFMKTKSNNYFDI